MLRKNIARHIAERALRTFKKNWTKSDAQTLFYAWPREERVVLIVDPLAFKDINVLLSNRYLHHLSTVLGGRRVVATNSRGIYLQVDYYPPKNVALDSLALDLDTQPGPWHLPIGQTKDGPLWLPLPALDAVLVGGARRMGKTRLLHGWIQALIHGAATDLILWDGKGATEFGRYRRHPRVTVIEELSDGLTELVGEMVRRADLFKRVPGGPTSLAEYNALTGEDLAPMALFIDEAAFVPAEAQAGIADLVARGGAFGLHPILATQRPDVSAVQSLVKANLATRIALPVVSVHDSMTILGRGGAQQLPKGEAGKGRLLIAWEGRLIEAQTFQVELPSGDLAPLLSQHEVALAEAALDYDGWFRIRELAEITGLSTRQVGDVAKRWEACGFLTEVLRNERGHVQGRRITDSLLQACGLGIPVDQVYQVDQA